MQQLADDGKWTPMESGFAPRVWTPRPNAEAAVYKCLMWTGLTCIPAMRVVDLATGEIVWQDSYSLKHAKRVIPAWAEPIYEQVRAELRETHLMTCLDCGARLGPLCPACVRVAHALGLTADQRSRMLGAPPLDLEAGAA